GEVLYIVEREQGLKAAHRAAAIIDQLPLTVMEPGRERTFAAAHVKARFPLSYADAFAVALAQELEARVVTGDPEFKKVASMVTVHWIATAKKKKTPGEKKPRGPETIRKKSTL
ncbi:MAG: type II toxin-antitoxin system VapC family toxin, partial [Vicinamibacteria bacterium]